MSWFSALAKRLGQRSAANTVPQRAQDDASAPRLRLFELLAASSGPEFGECPIDWKELERRCREAEDSEQTP